MNIAPETFVKLDKAITELLCHARLDTVEISKLLGREQSFGKYDGCTPQAILERATFLCRKINKQENEILKKAILGSPSAMDFLSSLGQK